MPVKKVRSLSGQGTQDRMSGADTISRPSLLRDLTSSTLNQLDTAGALVGTSLGATSGPVGAAAGAGIGGMTGKALEVPLRDLLLGGKTDLGEIPTAGATQFENEAGGQILGKGVGALRKLLPAARIQQNVLLHESEATGSHGAGMWEHLFERSLPSAGIMQEFRDRQAASITARADEVMREISRTSKLTSEQRGLLMQRALDSAEKRLSAEVSSAYGEIDALTRSTEETEEVTKMVRKGFTEVPVTVKKTKLVGGVPVSTDNLKAAAKRLYAEISAQERLLDPTSVSSIKSHLASIIENEEPVTFQAAQSTRSDLLQMVRKYDDILGNKKTAMYKLLSQGVDDDMMAAAKASGIPDLPEKLRAAQALAKEQHRLFGQQLVKQMAESAKPEELATFIRKGGLQEIRDLNKLLTPVQQKNMRVQVLSDILSEASKAQQLSPGYSPGGVLKLTPDIRVFRGDKVASLVNDLSEKGHAQLIFGQDYKNVKQFSDLIRRVHPSESTWVALHNALYLGAVTQAPTHPQLFAATAMEAGFTNMLARLIVKPEGLNAVTRFLQASAHHSPRLLSAALHEIQRQSREEVIQMQGGVPFPGYPKPPIPKELQGGDRADQ